METNNSELDKLFQEVKLEDALTNVNEEIIIEKEYHPSYESGSSPIPGQSVNVEDIDLEGKSLQEFLVEAANEKLQHDKEEEAYNYIPRSVFVANMLEYQEQQFFETYKHRMDGQTRRRVRKQIERDYDKGKYNFKKTLND